MGIFAALQKPRARLWAGYLASVLAPLAALGIQFGADDQLRGAPFVTFFPAVLLVAVLGGPIPAVAATLLSTALAAYFILDPTDSFALRPSGWVSVGFFILASSGMIWLVHTLRLTATELVKALDQLSSMNATLENRVAERTLELAEANTALKNEIETRQSAEAQARQAQKMEAIGQLTGGIAHDYNNMLAIIMGSLELAKRRLQSDPSDVGKYIDGALDGARRSADLTQRLLAFSRQQPLAPTSTGLNNLVQGMAAMLTRTLGTPAEFECVLEPDLWQAHIDSAQMESAILNLAVNARDAMPQGGKLIIETNNAVLDEAYAALQPDVATGDYVLVTVSDTGTGMTSEIIARAFDPFFTTKEPGKGTGLGLSQVYGFVKQSGGHIKIYSEPGQGTSVKIYLPRDFSEAENKPGAQLSQKAGPLPKGAQGEILLVVEDEDNVRHLTVNSLRELSYTVRHARSAAEALDILAEQHGIQLLLVDVIMPKMTGRELVKIVTQRFPGVKILYTTGYSPQVILQNGRAQDGRGEHGTPAHGVELLMKPFTLSQLAHKVRCMLDENPAHENP